MTDTRDVIVVPAPRFTAWVIVGAFVSFLGASLLASGDGLERLLGVPLALAGAFVLVWMLWGETRISFEDGQMLVRAILGARVLSERRYALGTIQFVRIDESPYALPAAFHSASGLPFRLDASNPPVRFEYQGVTVALGDGLDASARDKLRESIARAADAARGDAAGLTSASS